MAILRNLFVKYILYSFVFNPEENVRLVDIPMQYPEMMKNKPTPTQPFPMGPNKSHLLKNEYPGDEDHKKTWNAVTKRTATPRNTSII